MFSKAKEMKDKNLMTMSKIFDLHRIEPKPRTRKQMWVKDVGYDEAPWYQERMGLNELEDFLSVAAERIDYVKIATTQVLNHPSNWVNRKIELCYS